MNPKFKTYFLDSTQKWTEEEKTKILRELRESPEEFKAKLFGFLTYLAMGFANENPTFNEVININDGVVQEAFEALSEMYAIT